MRAFRLRGTVVAATPKPWTSWLRIDPVAPRNEPAREALDAAAMQGKDLAHVTEVPFDIRELQLMSADEYEAVKQ